MSRKHAGGKCCPAGKVMVQTRLTDGSVSELLTLVRAVAKLRKDQKSGAWKLSDEATINRRMLIGNGDVSAPFPKSMPAWQVSIGGKPRTKAQKRAIKKAKAEAKARGVNSQ